MKIIKLSNPSGEYLHVTPAYVEGFFFLGAVMAEYGVKVELVEAPTELHPPGYFGTRFLHRQAKVPTPLGELLDTLLDRDLERELSQDRTERLGYAQGIFQKLADRCEDLIIGRDGTAL